MNQVITRKETTKSERVSRTICSHCGWEVGPHAESAESAERSGKAKYRIIM